MNPHFIISPPEHPILKACIDKYYEIYNNKITYSYWGWSIVNIMAKVFAKIFSYHIHIEGIYYDTNNNKYQLLQEIYGGDAYQHYCKYKNNRILDNRYSSYDSVNHQFK